MSPDGADGATPVFFVAGGTGISAETLGNLMVAQFPSLTFVRRKIPSSRPWSRHEPPWPKSSLRQRIP